MSLASTLTLICIVSEIKNIYTVIPLVTVTYIKLKLTKKDRFLRSFGVEEDFCRYADYRTAFKFLRLAASATVEPAEYTWEKMTSWLFLLHDGFRGKTDIVGKSLCETQ